MIDKNDIQQEMEHAALLPASDPRRQALEKRLADAPSVAREQWHQLLAEQIAYRDVLPQVDVPNGLEDRLLALAHADPAPSQPAAPPNRFRSRVWWVAAAAVVLVFISAELMRWTTNASRMRTVALLAVNNHLNHLEDHGVEDSQQAVSELESSLSQQVGFNVAIPQMDQSLDLVGGRKCKLGTHPVAFLLWEDDRGEYSVFQFQPQQFGLPDNIPPRLVHAAEPAGTRHRCGAWIWTEEGRGYVLTGDPGTDVQRLKPANPPVQ